MKNFPEYLIDSNKFQNNRKLYVAHTNTVLQIGMKNTTNEHFECIMLTLLMAEFSMVIFSISLSIYFMMKKNNSSKWKSRIIKRYY